MTSSPKPPAPPPDVNTLLCFAIHSAGFAFNRLYRQPLRSLGLTYPQYLVMLTLWAGDDLTVGQVGEQLMLDTSTLTPLLKRLEAMGLVHRRRSTTDERRVMITLTEAGHAMRAASSEVTRCLAEGVGMSEAELATFTAQIRNLRDRLNAAAGMEAA